LRIGIDLRNPFTFVSAKKGTCDLTFRTIQEIETYPEAIQAR